MMEPKKTSRASRNTTDLKRKIIQKYDSGIKIAEIDLMYKKSTSRYLQLRRKRKAKIKGDNLSKGIIVLMKHRSKKNKRCRTFIINFNQIKAIGWQFHIESHYRVKSQTIVFRSTQKMSEENECEFTQF